MRVVFANLWCINPCVGKAVDDLLRHEPDLLALAEIPPRRFDDVARRLAGFQVAVAVPSDRRCVLGLFSRQPVAAAEVVAEGACRERPYGKVRVSGEFACTAWIAHTTAPFTAAAAARRDAQLGCLAEDAAATPGPAILLGDLNAGHRSAVVRRLAARGRLQCPRQDAAPHPTWPAPLPWQTFDHLLHRDDLLAEEFRAVRVRGSDHRALFGAFRTASADNSAAALAAVR